MNKRWKKILLFVGLPIVVGGLIYWFAWAGTTKPIEAVADQFKVPSSWKLTQSEAKAPGLCLAETCPRLQRVWTVSEFVSKDSLTKVLSDSGWRGTSDVDCGQESCTIRVSAGSYEAVIRSLSDYPRTNQFAVTLHMK
jgi:hypothetical protein